MAKVSQKLRSSALKAVLSNKFEEAVDLYRKILSKDPRDGQALNNLAIAYDSLGRYEEFFEAALRGLDVRPDDVDVINVLAVAEYKLGRHEASYKRLLDAVERFGMAYETAMNLCSVCGELNLHKEGLQYAVEAVRLQPTNPSAHNNLGSAFMSLGRAAEALHCFETTVMLEPNNSFAHTNIGVLLNKSAHHKSAIEHFQNALTLMPAIETLDTVRNRFFMGLSQLALGELEAGWANYEFGWKMPSGNGRNPKRTFQVPRWTGESLVGKSILVWREQGLGDEIFFFTAVRDLLSLGGNVIIECDPRIVPTLRRSYPTATVRQQQYYAIPPHKSFHNDFDFQIPVGSLFAHFRRSASDFQKSGPYFVVSPENSRVFDTRLGPRGHSLRVGVCWRSGDVSAVRNVHYSPISAWQNVFAVKGVQFVNLQYGDTTKEVLGAESEFGVSLNSWSDINRKDDLDELAALISQLDLVITVGTAVAQIAAAVGVPVWLMYVAQDWPQFGQQNYPVYPNVKMLRVPSGGSVAELLETSVPALLSELVQQRAVTPRNAGPDRIH